MKNTALLGAVLASGLSCQGAQAASFVVHLAQKPVQNVNGKVAAVGFAKAAAARLQAHRLKLRSLNRAPAVHPAGVSVAADPDALYQLIRQASGSESGYSYTLGSGPQQLESGTLPDLEVADSNATALYPGAIVQGRAQDIRAGHLVENPLLRSGGTLTIDGIHFSRGSQSQAIPVVNSASVQNALASLTGQPYAPDQGGSTYCSYSQVYNSDQAAYQVDASLSYLDIASVKNAFSETTDTTQNHVLVYCRQEYFTATFDPNSTDTSAGDDAFFDKNLSLDLAKRYIASGNPPLYIDSVTYGSELYILASSKSTASDMMDTLKVAVSYGGVSGSGSFTDHQTSVLNSMNVSAVARGGRATAQEGVLTSLTPGTVAAGLVSYIHNSINIAGGSTGPQEYGIPLSYHLSYLDFQPVAEVATVYGTKYAASPRMLKSALVHFHQDGDGKDWDTEVDLMLKNGVGGMVAQSHLGQHTPFGDNTTTQDYPINLVSPISQDELLNSGSFDIIIHPNGHDRWNYTAYLTILWDDGTKSVGLEQNWNDQNMTGRSVKLTSFIH